MAMFVFLSKFIPQFVLPLGLITLLLAAALILQKRPRAQRAILAAALVLVLLSGNRWVALGLASSLERQYIPAGEIPQADVILLLGGGTNSHQYPRPGVEVNDAGDRVIYAASLFHAGKAPQILVSGGVIEYLSPREHTLAEDMQVLLGLLGVPEDAILLQDRSRNTYEDALFSAAMLKELGFERVILVTSALHMPRSVGLFQAQGVDVIPAPADFIVTQADWDQLANPDPASLAVNLLPSAHNLQVTSSALKEYIGITVYRLRGDFK